MAVSDEVVKSAIIFASICCVVFGIVAIVYIVLMTYSYVKVANVINSLLDEKSAGQISRAVKSVEEATVSSNKPVTYEEARQFCKRRRKYLPIPQNQKAEDRIIKDISESKAADCRYVFFAYVANLHVRYQSSYGRGIRPSLKITRDGALPFKFTNCYVLKIFPRGKPRVISHEKCGTIANKNLLVLTTVTDYCDRHRYRCVDVYSISSEDSVPIGLLKARKNNSKLLMLPYDKNNHPENLRLRRFTAYKFFVVMATRYYFRYEFGGIQQRYKSKRFTVIDPEYDCLAYDTARDKLVTQSCHNLGCPICY